jgi:hypothetical protein
MKTLFKRSAMRPFLMGSETEYAVSGRNGRTPLSPEFVHGLLYDAVRQERRCLADAIGGRGLYLENGARFYLDHGAHPEYATPECFTPTQVASYDKAGERLLELAWTRVLENRHDLEITILKNNLNSLAPDDITWGNHESYTCWVAPELAAPALIPHVVSRIIYAGAGCLSAYAGGEGFELSQRARHLVKVIGNATTADRAVFCTRVRKASDRSLSGGWSRVHLIGKDSHRAPFGTYLTFGTTGLLMLLVNANRTVGQGLALEDPLQALRTISCDPWLRTPVRLADGRRFTALEVQESYLADCEREIQTGSFPLWARDVIRHWRETLADLARDPFRLARRLDPYYKLFVYDHELRRAGCTWAGLRQALQDLATVRTHYTADVIQAVLQEKPADLSVEGRGQYERAITALALHRPGVLDRLRLAVRLHVFDLHYHELGGLYDQLAAAGQVEGVVIGPDDVDLATRIAPPGGRAAVRGECVRSLQEGGWVCEWRYLYHGARREFVDLRNPFTGTRWTGSWAGRFEDNRYDPDMLEIAAQLTRL